MDVRLTSLKTEWKCFWAASVLLLLGAYLQWLSLGFTEVLGFITGAACVLLVIEQHIWNFPIGIANNIFFIILFLSARLYGDMALQVVYIGFALHGWYTWLYGGEKGNALSISHTSTKSWAVILLLAGISTYVLTLYLSKIHDAFPFLDALTTVMSLVAQYLLNTKKIENWYVWIAADVLYIGLYIYKDLYLTAGLYLVFISMCIAGLLTWNKSMKQKVCR